MQKYFLIYLLLLTSCFQGYSQIIRRYEDSSTLLNKLNTYHSDTIKGIYYSGFYYNKNVSNQIQKKILSLLKGEWTEAEINEKVKKLLITDFDFINFNKVRVNAYLQAEEIYSSNVTKMLTVAKKDTSKSISKQYLKLHDSLYRVIYDSMANSFKKEIGARIKQSTVPDEIVLSTATCKVTEAIPILKNSLATGDRKHNKDAVELALAGLGLSEYQELFYKKHELYIQNFRAKKGYVSEHWSNLMSDCNAMELISTQKSTYLLHEWLDTSYTYNANSEGSSINKQYVGGIAVYIILRLVQNKDLHEAFNKLPKSLGFLLPEDGFVTEEQLLFVKKWLIENKGKYQFYSPK